jgi:hypothetical protein
VAYVTPFDGAHIEKERALLHMLYNIFDFFLARNYFIKILFLNFFSCNILAMCSFSFKSDET